jgi:DNA-binding NarL/FixJ family response regulator
VTIRVLLADDHAVVRDGLRAVLSQLDGFEVVGEAATGGQAVATARRTRPDVVLMDVRMPDIDGVEATRRIREIVPDTAVLMLTMFDDDVTVAAAIKAGARGYLLKDAGHAEIANALRAVVSGQAIFGAGVAGRLLTALSTTTRPAADYPFPQLGAREREILEMLVRGRRTSEMAAALHLSPKTISNQLTVIFRKLGTGDRAEAVLLARDRGLGGSR